MKRPIVLNRFFYPDHSATSQILTDLMLHFAASGVDVHVITSRQLMTIPRGNCRPKRSWAGFRRRCSRTTRWSLEAYTPFSSGPR
jgi:colanic acid biosynthesis glycosyl transferase WcaI